MKRTGTTHRGATPAPPRKQAGTTPDRWDLSHLLKRPQHDLERLLADMDRRVRRFEACREHLRPDLPPQTFLGLLQQLEAMAAETAKLGAYAYLWFSENTKNAHARALKATVEERLTGLQNRLLFFDLWWQSVDDANAARLLDASGDFRYYLESIRRFKAYTLSEPEEKIINLKTVTGRSAVNTLYDVLTNGFTFTLTVNGKPKALSREQLAAYLRHPKPQVREAAYRELYRVFDAHHDVLGEIYATIVKDWKGENLELRKYASPMTVRNVGNDIPDQATSALLAVCADNAGIFQEYFRLKARICKITPMNRFHIYAPHPADRKRYRYADAVQMVLDAYRAFSPQLGDLARRVFDERHIDARTRPGKLSGAYCYSVVPGFTPYVLLNYTGEARDVATLAHELGHAVHGLMAERHTVFTFHSTLPLAETASVFGERILSDALTAQEHQRSAKQGLLLAQLDDIYATVLRQAYFVLFEQRAHDMIAHGATAEDLAAAYQANLRDQFGKAVPVPALFRWEWLTIPHIFASPFYCYAYSFGNLLVLALYHMYKQQGQAFVPQYLALLAAGGSQSPDSILATMGVNMRDKAFWQSGFNTIKGMVEELERTMD
ncbi:MAG: M3 family oligoendopeptidase [Nitrospirota bacterium]|nr:M3 family oligoendopeptidase [Nitrospirota bacterium]